MRARIGVLFCVVFIAMTVAAQTPDALWTTLLDGNRAYVAGHVKFDDLAELRHHSAGHQSPPYTVISCADSHVPPELIFNQSINDLFVIRVAGNVVGPYDLASIEYAIANSYTKMIVVMGHAECGAVRAALSDKAPGSPSLVSLVTKIRESLGGIPRNLDPATVRKAVEANTRATAADLLKSKIIADAVKSGKVAVVTAYYDLDSGKVERLKWDRKEARPSQRSRPCRRMTACFRYISSVSIMRKASSKRPVARVFKTGRSQAVRLPKELRFDDDVVLVHREGDGRSRARAKLASRMGGVLHRRP